MASNSYRVIYQKELDILEEKLKNKKRQMDAILTVKEYKDPAEKLVKTQDHYKSELDKRPSVLERYIGDFRRKITHKQSLKEKVERELSAKEKDYEVKMESIDREFEAKRKEYEAKKEALKRDFDDKALQYKSKMDTYDTDIEQIESDITSTYNNDPETIRLRTLVTEYDDKITKTRENNKTKGQLMLESEFIEIDKEIKKLKENIVEVEEAEKYVMNQSQAMQYYKNNNESGWSEYMLGREEQRKKEKDNRNYQLNLSLNPLSPVEIWAKEQEAKMAIERISLKEQADKEIEEQKQLLTNKRKQEAIEYNNYIENEKQARRDRNNVNTLVKTN